MIKVISNWLLSFTNAKIIIAIRNDVEEKEEYIEGVYNLKYKLCLNGIDLNDLSAFVNKI